MELEGGSWIKTVSRRRSPTGERCNNNDYKGCFWEKRASSLLSDDSEGLSASASGLGSLTSDSLSPEVSQTSVVLGLSHSLEILSETGIQVVGDKLSPGTFLWVLLSVQEPFWDVVLSCSGDDIGDNLDLVLNELSGSLVNIDLSNLEGKNSESSTDTFDLSETEWSLLFTVDVCVLHSQDMSEFVRVLQYQ